MSHTIRGSSISEYVVKEHGPFSVDPEYGPRGLRCLDPRVSKEPSLCALSSKSMPVKEPLEGSSGKPVNPFLFQVVDVKDHILIFWPFTSSSLSIQQVRKSLEEREKLTRKGHETGPTRSRDIDHSRWSWWNYAKTCSAECRGNGRMVGTWDAKGNHPCRKPSLLLATIFNLVGSRIRREEW